MNHWNIALGVACTALAIGTANATVDQPANSTATELGACSQLPRSERGICKQEALGSNSPSAGMTAANEQPALDAANAAYASALAACRRLPLSERGLCTDQARANSYGGISPAVPAAERQALTTENARYQAAVTACHRLPVSQWNTCMSDAGTDESLLGTR